MSVSHPQAPAAINPWLIVVFAALMNAVTVGIGVYAFAYFVMPWVTEFQVERSTIMLAITFSSIAVAIISPLAGYCVDHFNVRRLLLGGALSFSAGLVGIAYAPSHTVVILLFSLVVPLGMAFAGPLMGYALVVRTGISRMGLAMGIAALGTSVGGFVLPVVVTQLLDGHDWRTVFLYMAAAVLVLVLVPALLLVRATVVARGGAGGSHGSPFALMRSLPVMQLALAYLVPSLLFISILHNLGALAADLGVEQKSAALVTAVASVLMAIAKVTAGILADRINYRILYLGIVVLMALGMVLTSLGGTYITLLVGVGLTAIAIGAAAPLINAIIHVRWGAASFGRVIGVVHAVAGLSALGSLFAGFVRDSGGTYATAFLLLTLALIPAAVAFMILTRPAPVAAAQPL
jgi:MFS family permease